MNMCFIRAKRRNSFSYSSYPSLYSAAENPKTTPAKRARCLDPDKATGISIWPPAKLSIAGRTGHNPFNAGVAETAEAA